MLNLLHTFHLGLENLQEDAIGRQLMENTAYELQCNCLGTAGQWKTILALPGMCAAQAYARIESSSLFQWFNKQTALTVMLWSALRVETVLPWPAHDE